MISATTVHAGASKQIQGSDLTHSPGSGRAGNSPVGAKSLGKIGAGGPADANRTTADSFSRERVGFASRGYSGAPSFEGLRGRNKKDTPAELLESMIMQMGGGPYSTYKGMYIDLAV